MEGPVVWAVDVGGGVLDQQELEDNRIQELEQNSQPLNPLKSLNPQQNPQIPPPILLIALEPDHKEPEHLQNVKKALPAQRPQIIQINPTPRVRWEGHPHLQELQDAEGFPVGVTQLDDQELV